MKKRTGILMILDGFGINPSREYNAVALAQMPNYQALLKKFPHTQLETSEEAVGLPKGFMGNSEVGHLNIGAGRVVYQDFSLISHAIETGTFFKNPALLALVDKLKHKQDGTLHLMGLVSDGGVHSHLSHLFALLKFAKENGIKNVQVHCITDGRDTSPTSGAGFIADVQQEIKKVGLGEIATVTGRFYAMDRDNRWERIEKAYRAIVEKKSATVFTNPKSYIEESYKSQQTDEFLIPACNTNYTGMHDGDAVVFFNFRADRAREISRALTQENFSEFSREKFPRLHYLCMTPYDASLQLPVAYQKPKVENTLGQILSHLGVKQLRIAETEKYAHVTYFFNGGEEKVFPGEKRILIPSPREVKTYDLKPEMSAVAVTDALLKELTEDTYQLAVVNFANPDMVGHTGVLEAAMKAVETVDACLGRILQWVEKNGAFLILTADHGNCEKMCDESGKPFTSHTLLPVPFILVDATRLNASLKADGRLCNIAPTLLELWEIPKPKEMDAASLLSC